MRTGQRWKIHGGRSIGGVEVIDDRIVRTARCFWWLEGEWFSRVREQWEPRGWTFTEMPDEWVLERNAP